MTFSNKVLVELIDKIRNCPFLKNYYYILKYRPQIYVEYTERKGIELEKITFFDWDSIEITNKKIVYFPEHDTQTIILSYKNWDELFEILNIKKDSDK